MSATLRNLTVLCYGNNFTLWHYRTDADPLRIVRSLNYFAAAGDSLKRGDMIHISAIDGGSVLFVSKADADSVTLSPLS